MHEILYFNFLTCPTSENNSNCTYMCLNIAGNVNIISVVAVNRNVGFSVYIFNESSFVPMSPTIGPGYTIFTQDTTTCPTRMMNITVNKLTKGVALFNAKDPSSYSACEGYTTFATIEVCEVQVMGNVIDAIYVSVLINVISPSKGEKILKYRTESR